MKLETKFYVRKDFVRDDRDGTDAFLKDQSGVLAGMVKSIVENNDEMDFFMYEKEKCKECLIAYLFNGVVWHGRHADLSNFESVLSEEIELVLHEMRSEADDEDFYVKVIIECDLADVSAISIKFFVSETADNSRIDICRLLDNK